MPLIKSHTVADHVTLINLFTVAPKDQLGLARVQLGDMYWFGKRAPGAISASFHRSLCGHRFFNYGQWQSVEALNQNRLSPDFAQHLRNYRYFDMKSDPQLYEVVATSADRPLVLRWPSSSLASLECFTLSADRAESCVESLLALHHELDRSGSGPLAWALHRGVVSPRTANVAALQARADDDGGVRRRVAVYAQWAQPRDHERHEASAPVQSWLDRHLKPGDERDSRLYELVGTSDD